MSQRTSESRVHCQVSLLGARELFLYYYSTDCMMLQVQAFYKIARISNKNVISHFRLLFHFFFTTVTSPGARFSKAPEPFRVRKAVAKSRTLRFQSCFIHIFLIWTDVPFIQEVSGVYTSPFLDTDELKMALRARKVSGAFEKRAPGAKLFIQKWIWLVKQWTCKKKLISIWKVVHQDSFWNRGKSNSEMS